MKTPFLAIVSALLLTACSAGGTVSYTLETDVTDMERREILADQALRVIERRLESMGEIPTSTDKTVEEDELSVTVSAEHQEALDALTEQLTTPFKMRIMAQTDEGEKADITVDGHGGFKEAGITEDDLEWVEGSKEAGRDTGMVKLVFTEAGRAKMATLFKAMKGKNIGLFVRDQLVSKMEVETDELKDDIIIRDIPTAELAVVFGDDVNIGINVTFTPVP